MWTVASNTEFFLPLKVLIPINFNTNLIPSWLKILQFKISISLSHSFVPTNKFIIFTFLLDHKESNIRILIARVALEHGLAKLGDWESECAGFVDAEWVETGLTFLVVEGRELESIIVLTDLHELEILLYFVPAHPTSWIINLKSWPILLQLVKSILCLFRNPWISKFADLFVISIGVLSISNFDNRIIIIWIKSNLS